MKKSKDKKKIFFNYQNSFFLFIIIGFVLLTIGYATINSITFNILGDSSAKVVDNVYINSAYIVSSDNADVSVSNPTYSKNYLEDVVSLSTTDKDANVVYKVEIYNGSKQDIFFDCIYQGILPNLNDNADIVVDVIDDGTFIESKTSKDFYVTIKYRDNLETITNNSVNVGLSFRFKKNTTITYVGFNTDISSYPKTVIEGNDLTITFESDIEYVTLIRNNEILVRGKDFTFNNNTLIYHAVSGGKLEINAENNHPIKDIPPLEGISPNMPFVLMNDSFYSYNADTATIYLEVDLSNITTLNSKDNIISIGTEIERFNPWKNGGVNLHLYYPDSSRGIIVSPIMHTPSSHMQFVIAPSSVDSKIAKIALNGNGLYYNGMMILSPSGRNTSVVSVIENLGTVTEADYLQSFFSQISNNLQVKMGSVEGANRSNAMYNDFIVFDSKLTEDEMIRLTNIDRSNRDDFDIINLLNSNNPIIKNQEFKVVENGIFNIYNQTLIVEMDVSDTIYENENILSLGKDIGEWVPKTSGDSQLHFYYNSNRYLIIAPLINGVYTKQYEKTITLIDDRYIKIGFGLAGVYLNGEKLFDSYTVGPNIKYKGGGTVYNDSSYFTKFFKPWINGNYVIDIGSTQGDSRSNAVYSKFDIYDDAMTEQELIYYTGIGESSISED